MSASNRTSCRLRVEFLEGRSLPSGLAGAVALPSVPDSFTPSDTRVGGLTPKDTSADADELRILIDPSARHNTIAIAIAPSGSSVVGGSAPFANRIVAFDPDDSREEQKLAVLALDLCSCPATVVDLSPSVSVRNAHPEVAPSDSTRVLPSTGSVVGLPATQLASEFRGIVFPQGEADPLASEAASVAISPVGSAARSGLDTTDLVHSAPSRDAIPLAGRDVFFDSLAGTPIGAAVATDLRALDDAAQEFFEHLANLAPDWAPESEWTEYLWTAAAVLLVSSGVHFVRRASRRSDRRRSEKDR